MRPEQGTPFGIEMVDDVQNDTAEFAVQVE